MDIDRKTIVEAIYGAGCLKFGKFILSSGKESDVYVDLRLLYSYPNEFKKIIEALIEKINSYVFDCICGIPTGGLPLSVVVAYLLNKPFIYVRKKEKSYGRKRRIEGNLTVCNNVLIIDDVATTGRSLKDAIEVLREAGCVVDETLVVVDREEGARDNLLNLGVKLNSLITLKDILEWWNKYGKSKR